MSRKRKTYPLSSGFTPLEIRKAALRNALNLPYTVLELSLEDTKLSTSCVRNALRSLQEAIRIIDNLS